MFVDNEFVKDPIIKDLTLVRHENVSRFKSMLVSSESSISIGFVNQYAYNLSSENKIVSKAFKSLTYRLRDGIGLKIACEINGCDPGCNLNGTDFIPDLIDLYLSINTDADIFVFGTQEPWLTLGSEALFSHAKVLKLDGFQHTDEYLSFFTKLSSPGKKSIVLLAMGMPKQEFIANKIINASTAQVLVICGGAIVDFSSKRFKRAPSLLRRFGLEWLYRLAVEPKRLFSRYVIGIPIFFCHIFKNISFFK